MDECIVCHEPLNKSEKIYAGLGALVCSKTCAAKHLVETVDAHVLAEYAVATVFEEITHDEIGIAKSNICSNCKAEFDEGDLMNTNFGKLCADCIDELELDGKEVGATCDWCEVEFNASELTKTDLGMLCDRCIAAIRSRGEEVIVLE